MFTHNKPEYSQMKFFASLLSCITGAAIAYPILASAQPAAMQQPLNMIAYEHKTPHQYAIVSYMPYYPAYGMISYRSPQCNAEIAGYIDPFALKKKKLVITYKTCKVSFNMTENDQILSNPSETPSCQEYHPKECSFSKVPALHHISLENHS